MLCAAVQTRAPAPASRALLARLASPPDLDERLQLDAFVRSAGTDLAMFDQLAIFAWRHDGLNRLNLGSGGAPFDAVPVGGLAYVPGYGVQSDGSTGEIAFGITPASLSGASVLEGTQLVYVADDASNVHVLLGTGTSGSAVVDTLIPRNSSGACTSRSHSQTQTPIRNVATANGLTAITRGSATPYAPATDYLVYTNGAPYRATVAPVSLPAGPLKLFPGGNVGADGLTRSTHQVALCGYAKLGVALSLIQRLESLTTRLLTAKGYVSPIDAAPGDDDANSSHDGPGPFTYSTMAAVSGVADIIMSVGGKYPASDTQSGQSYFYYPLTIAMMSDLTGAASAAGSTCTTVKVMHNFWGVTSRSDTANPAQPKITWAGPSGDLVQECRSIPIAAGGRSALQNGDDTLVAEIMSTCGYTLAECQADAPNITLVDRAVAAAHPELYYAPPYDNRFRHYYTASNLAVLPTWKLTDLPAGRGWGVRLDGEMQDNRTPAQLVSLIQRIAGKVHARGFKFYAWFNAIGGGGAGQSGFNAVSAPDVIAACDLVSLNVRHSFGDLRASIDTQMQLMGNPSPAKIALSIGLGLGSTVLTPAQDAATRQALLDYGFAAVHFVPYGATFGGALSLPVNQTIATVGGLPTS